MPQSVILSGGTVVTGSGSQKVDIVIENGQIRQVSPKYQLLTKRRIDPSEIIDISGFYVLPGFISLQHRNRMTLSIEGMNHQLHTFITQGITSFIDVLSLSKWQGKDHLDHLLSLYQGSYMDYAVRTKLPSEMFTYSHVRMLCYAGHRWIDLIVNSKEQLDEIEWDKLYPLLSHFHTILSLVIPEDTKLSPLEREQIKYEWYEVCRYGNLRTLVQGKTKLAINDEYYLIQQLSSEEIPGHLSMARRNNWLAPGPFVATLEDWQEPLSTKDWSGEDFLSILVRLASTNVAKAAGLFPIKGCIAPGADADLLLVEKSEWLTNFDRSTMLKISEKCLPTYVMSKGQWRYVFGKDVHQGILGKYLQHLKPYNYAI